MTTRWLIAALALVAVAAGGYAYERHQAARSATAAVSPYAVAQARMGDVNVQVSASGTVQPSATFEVHADVGGRVVSVPNVGDVVKKGDPLVVLQDDGTLQQRVLQAQQQLVSDQEALDQLLHPDPATPSEIKAAQARIDADRQRVAQDQLDLQRLTVTAPIPGLVHDIKVVEGDAVSGSAAQGTVLLSILDDSRVLVQAQVSQSDIARVHVGDRASLNVPGLTGVVSGVVESVGLVSSGSDKNGPYFPVTVRFDDPPATLAQGASVNVNIDPEDGPIVLASGTVQPSQTRTVMAQVSGTVEQILVHEGDRVAEGDALVKLRNDQLPIQLASDQAQLAQDEDALQALLHPAPPKDQDVQLHKLKVDQDQLAVEMAQADLAHLHVASPVDGVVTAVDVRPGDDVSPGTALVEVQSTGTLQVVASVDEIDIDKVHPGQTAVVRATALPSQTFQGTVAHVSPTGQNSQGVSTFNVTIDLPQAAGLKVGMSVTADIAVAQKRNVLVVPVEAVIGSGDAAAVRVLDASGRPVLRRVTVGLTSDTVAEITSGLQVGDRVVTAVPDTGTGAFRTGRGGFPGFEPGFVNRIGGGRGAGGGAGRGENNAPGPGGR